MASNHLPTAAMPWPVPVDVADDDVVISEIDRVERDVRPTLAG
jgi:hypothetical protein